MSSLYGPCPLCGELLYGAECCKTKTATAAIQVALAKIDELAHRAFNTPQWVAIHYKTTPSGKQLFLCTGCGAESPAPTKSHDCEKYKQSLKQSQCVHYFGQAGFCVKCGAEGVGDHANPFGPNYKQGPSA